jgi:DNA-binding beta-propeller fold protein YncE
MRRHLISCLLLATPFAVMTSLVDAQTSASPVLLVVNQGDHDLGFVDPVSAKEVTTLDVGGITGHEVAVSADGRTAFVPIYGNSGVGRPGTDGHNMVVVDIPSQKIVGNVDFGHGVRPHCAVYDAKDGLLYVTTELDQSITIINPHTLKIVGSIPTTQSESHMLAISHNGRFGYTANVGPGTVSVLDMKARKTIAVIPVSAQTQRISISRDDSMVFTADQKKAQLAVIDTTTNKIKTWVPLPAVASGMAAGFSLRFARSIKSR